MHFVLNGSDCGALYERFEYERGEYERSRARRAPGHEQCQQSYGE
jgi:hypothetical protein